MGSPTNVEEEHRALNGGHVNGISSVNGNSGLHPVPHDDNKVIVVLGAQWGDEGKGKLVDLLATKVDVVCRCQVRFFY